MTIIQSGKVDGFLARPPEGVNAVLIYGPDSGLVSERATLLSVSYIDDSADTLSVTRLTSGDLAEDSGRLADEATSMGLFGGRRVVRVRPESQQIAGLLESLLPRIDDDLLLIVEAGQLRANAKLRKLFEGTQGCAAIPCYQDNDQDLARILTEQARKSGFTIEEDARLAMIARLGGDRLASRNEIEKLCLYAHGRDTITLKDVDAVAGNVSALALDDLCDAFSLGDLTRTDHLLERLQGSGTGPDQIIAAAIRHMLLLHEMRAEVEAGGRAGDIVARRRPPIFFKRKQAILAQIQRWPISLLNRALEILGDGEKAARRGDGLASASVSNALLSICHQAGKLARR